MIIKRELIVLYSVLLLPVKKWLQAVCWLKEAQRKFTYICIKLDQSK